MKKLALALVLVLLATSFFSCGAAYSADEVKTALETLLPAADEMNIIYFGEGLPLSEDEGMMEAFYAAFDTDVESVNYAPVAEDCGYTTEEDLRKATLAVYTEDYAAFLFERAFTGISSTSENADGETTTTSAMYARYIEQDGYFTRRLGLDDEALPLNRTYDIDTASIVKQKKDYVLVDVQSYVDGEEDEVVRLKLVMTENGWRLDSPTY